MMFGIRNACAAALLLVGTSAHTPVTSDGMRGTAARVAERGPEVSTIQGAVWLFTDLDAADAPILSGRKHHEDTTDAVDAPDEDKNTADSADKPDEETPTVSPTMTPTASPTISPTTSPTTSPTMTPTADSADTPAEDKDATDSAENSAEDKDTEDSVKTMDVRIQYDLIQSNCDGFTANNVMTGVNNTLKEGLVTATTAITVGILNETFPRTKLDEPKRQKTPRKRRQQRGLARFGSTTTPSSPTDSISRHRNLVYHTTLYPVTITRVLDMSSGCPIGQKCVLVMSSIPLVLEPGDDPDEVKGAVASGIQDSVDDGSFFGAIPTGTVDCPTVQVVIT